MGNTTDSESRGRVDEQKDPFPDVKGVLLGDWILKYIETLSPQLIEGADTKKNLKPASYSLRLGDNFYQDGSYGKLTDESPIITIRPHGMVFVSTKEKLHMPRYLIGRWNLRVSLVYRGLLWAGGPQVDPGFSGPLFCPLYNLSSREVTLSREEEMFTIDFAKTTEYSIEVAKENPALNFTTKRFELKEYVPSYEMKSSISELAAKIQQIDDETTRKINDLQSTVLIGLSIVFAGLTVVATLPAVPSLKLTSNIDPTTVFYLVVSIGSLIISIFAFNRTRGQKKPKQPKK